MAPKGSRQIQQAVRNLRQRVRFGSRIRVGHWMRMRLGIVWPGMEIGMVRFQTDLAIAAIAAGAALVAEMIGARILRALHADARRLFFANAADE
jgi:hypothetical protein